MIPSKESLTYSLAKTKLNWQPKVALNDGLALTIEYFKHQLLGKA